MSSLPWPPLSSESNVFVSSLSIVLIRLEPSWGHFPLLHNWRIVGKYFLNTIFGKIQLCTLNFKMIYEITDPSEVNVHVYGSRHRKPPFSAWYIKYSNLHYKTLPRVMQTPFWCLRWWWAYSLFEYPTETTEIIGSWLAGWMNEWIGRGMDRWIHWLDSFYWEPSLCQALF